MTELEAAAAATTAPLGRAGADATATLTRLAGRASDDVSPEALSVAALEEDEDELASFVGSAVTVSSASAFSATSATASSISSKKSSKSSAMVQ